MKLIIFIMALSLAFLATINIAYDGQTSVSVGLAIAAVIGLLAAGGIRK